MNRPDITLPSPYVLYHIPAAMSIRAEENEHNTNFRLLLGVEDALDIKQ